MHKAKLAILLALLTCVTSLPTRAATLTPAQPLEVRSGVISLILRADHSRYAVGQAIMLRASVRNEGAKNYYVQMMAPWHMLELTITDSKGKVVNNRGPVSAEFKGPAARRLAPGQIAPLITTDGTEWASLSKWGYGVLPPGAYLLKATLHTVTTALNDDANPRSGLSDHFIAGGNGAVATLSFTVNSD